MCVLYCVQFAFFILCVPFVAHGGRGPASAISALGSVVCRRVAVAFWCLAFYGNCLVLGFRMVGCLSSVVCRQRLCMWPLVCRAWFSFSRGG